MLGAMQAAARILAGFHKIEPASCNQHDMLLPVAKLHHRPADRQTHTAETKSLFYTSIARRV
jgi:hypothetical protein